MDNKKRAHHMSVPIAPANHSESCFIDDYPPPAYQPPQNPGLPPMSKSHQHNLNTFNQPDQFYYQPTPPPQTVIIYRQPTRSKDACCWGCLAALCLCFGAKECC